MRKVRTGLVCAALMAAAASADAQTNAWYNPYVKGVKAVESARYAEGAALLERAVSEDPRSARNKYIEGVFRTDYVPYFYLALAYSRLGEVAKAQINAAKAATVVPPAIAPRLSDLRRELARKAAPASAAAKTSAQQPAPPPPPRTGEGDAQRGDVIVTTGQATVRRPPDVAYLTVGVETRAKSPRDAQQQNADAMAAAQRRLTDSGIPRDALRTLGLDLQQEFDFNQGRRVPRDYVARNAIEVRVDQIARVGELLDAAVQAGATSTSGVRFDLKDRTSAEREAMRLAVADARARADAAAAWAGRAIGRVVKIEEAREGAPIVMGRAMVDIAAAAPPGAQTPVEPGYIEIRARVTLTASMR